MEGRKVHFCNSLEWRLLPGPRRARSSTGWSCHGPPPASKGGRSEPLGWDFELSDLGTLIGGGTRTVWRLFFVPRRGSSLDWNATQALGEGTVGTPLLVSLCCLGPRLPSLLPGSFNPWDPCASMPAAFVASLPIPHSTPFAFGIPAVGASIALGDWARLVI